MGAVKACARCGELLPLEAFYFVSKKLGTRRGQCKACMAEIKQAQKDPLWRPTCARCGETRPRSGPGRRLCEECFASVYDAEDGRDNGSHRLRLKPCSACGAKRLRGDHVKGTSLCAVCRSVPQSRRKRLQTYRLTPREFVELVEAQGGRCAICRREPRGSLHVDHRHADLSIRGAVCNRCNTVLGLARDNPATLEAAAAYLADPPAQRLFPGRVALPVANRYRPLRRSRGAAA